MPLPKPAALLVAAVGAIVLITLSLRANGTLPIPYLAHLTGEPRYIFVDLGANSADSLDVFLHVEGAKFEFDFPRPDWATYKEAEIYLFEANPHFNTHLVKAKERCGKLGINVNIFPSTVVDTQDGIRTFFLDKQGEAWDFWGSSVMASHPDVKTSDGTNLTSINISRWLLMNFLPQDFVVVKMDIEGAEFEVIPHMVDMDVWTVMDYLLVEWHGHVLPREPTDPPGQSEYALQRALAAESKLKEQGVLMPNYDSPA